jgi:peptide chain release factor 2
MDNLLKQLEELRERVQKTWQLLNIDKKIIMVKEAKELMSASDFWNDRKRAVEISQQTDEMDKEIKEWENLLTEIKDLEDLTKEAVSEQDETINDVAQEQFEAINNKYEKLEFYVMFSGKYDSSGAIVSIHAGTGGVDAQDWAQILERMILRFAEKMNWKTEIIDRNQGAEAGIKSATINIKGRWAYGYLKSESGVHRLVRISPFDAESMRHTSFALVEVIPELPETADIEINEADLKIDVFRSSGPGGQSVNTTDSAIRIKHEPSGIIVTCQNERSQHQNKETAMKILKAKLFKLEEERREAEELKLRGENQVAEWGKQIRSYVMQPYKMVKDHRTQNETQDIDGVLNGDLEGFMEAYLRWIRKKN